VRETRERRAFSKSVCTPACGKLSRRDRTLSLLLCAPCRTARIKLPLSRQVTIIVSVLYDVRKSPLPREQASKIPTEIPCREVTVSRKRTSYRIPYPERSLGELGAGAVRQVSASLLVTINYSSPFRSIELISSSIENDTKINLIFESTSTSNPTVLYLNL